MPLHVGLLPYNRSCPVLRPKAVKGKAAPAPPQAGFLNWRSAWAAGRGRTPPGAWRPGGRGGQAGSGPGCLKGAAGAGRSRAARPRVAVGAPIPPRRLASSRPVPPRGAEGPCAGSAAPGPCGPPLLRAAKQGRPPEHSHQCRTNNQPGRGGHSGLLACVASGSRTLPSAPRNSGRATGRHGGHRAPRSRRPC